MSKPPFRAFIVENAPQGSPRKARWTEIGAVWLHKNGHGFDVILTAGIAVSGRIVCVPPRDKTDKR